MAKKLIYDKKGIDHRQELENFLLQSEVKWDINWLCTDPDIDGREDTVTFSMLIKEPKVGYISFFGTKFSRILPSANVPNYYKNTIDLDKIHEATIYENHDTDLGVKTELTKRDVLNYNKKKDVIETLDKHSAWDSFYQLLDLGE